MTPQPVLSLRLLSTVSLCLSPGGAGSAAQCSSVHERQRKGCLLQRKVKSLKCSNCTIIRINLSSNACNGTANMNMGHWLTKGYLCRELPWCQISIWDEYLGEGPFHKHSFELGTSRAGSVTVDRCKSLNGRKEKTNMFYCQFPPSYLAHRANIHWKLTSSSSN